MQAASAREYATDEWKMERVKGPVAIKEEKWQEIGEGYGNTLEEEALLLFPGLHTAALIPEARQKVNGFVCFRRMIE